MVFICVVIVLLLLVFFGIGAIFYSVMLTKKAVDRSTISQKPQRCSSTGKTTLLFPFLCCMRFTRLLPVIKKSWL